MLHRLQRFHMALSFATKLNNRRWLTFLSKTFKGPFGGATQELSLIKTHRTIPSPYMRKIIKSQSLSKTSLIASLRKGKEQYVTP